jgi:hypothetical protein
MVKSIDEYLSVLKVEMEGSDSATIQDALADAEDHLHTAFENIRAVQPEMESDAALQTIIDQYGSPAETAAAYKEVERRTSPGLVRISDQKPQPMLSRFFGIYADPKTWGALLYMAIALITGIIYFTWITTGISLILGLAVLIIGLPFAALFLISVRGIALLEGRMVEALLGVRMPRRPLFSPQNTGWLLRLKMLFLDKHTWMTTIYMLLQMPLGIVYITILSSSLILSLGFIALPVLQTVYKLPIMLGDGHAYILPLAGQIAVAVWGVCLWTSIMHLVKFIGQLHGRFAKFMLVSD